MPASFTELQKPDGFYAWDGVAWTFDIVTARADAVAAVDAKRAEVLASPFEYDGNRFNADAGSITQIAAMAQLATVAKLAEKPYTMIWTSADGVASRSMRMGWWGWRWQRQRGSRPPIRPRRSSRTRSRWPRTKRR